MKKILIYAYTNYNLGDDLFIKILCERYPTTQFVLNAPKGYKKNFKNNKNLKIVSNNTYISKAINLIFKNTTKNNIIKEFIYKKYDGAVYIGGSIYMQHGNWKQTLEKKSNYKLKNKPFFVIGANFGPYNDQEFYIKYRELFKTYTDICFRDDYSFDLFKALDNVRKADDVIFQLAKNQKNITRNEKNIVISVIKPSIRKDLAGFDDIYYKKIKDIAIFFIKKNYNITFISFCENEGDKEAINKITEIIPGKYMKKINKYFYKKNIKEALNIIAKSNFVVGTRFHAMILGWVYNKPVYPITYSEKMVNVINDINFKGNYTNFNNLYSIEPEDVFESMYTNSIDVSSHSNNAEKQFEKLDEYLSD